MSEQPKTTKAPNRMEHNWLMIALAAKGDQETITALQDCWAEIGRLRSEIVSMEERHGDELHDRECEARSLGDE